MYCKKCSRPTNGSKLCPECAAKSKKRKNGLLWIIPAFLAVIALVLTSMLVVHSISSKNEPEVQTVATKDGGKVSFDGYFDYVLSGEVGTRAPSYEALEDHKEQTFLIYLVGSDLESNGSFASDDLFEIMEASVDVSKSNVIVFTGGSTYWHIDIPADTNSILSLGADGSFYRVQERELSNMGDPETLSFFLEYGYYSYPADEYNLILWNHGGGSIAGYGFDIISDDNLDLPEIKSALSASPFNGENKLNWVAFDACLMSTIETADVFAEHADYLIASEEMTSAAGFNYACFGPLSQTKYSGPQAAEILIDYTVDYLYAQNSYSLEYMADHTPYACLDLSKTDEVETAMNNLFGALNSNIQQNFSAISRVRSELYTYGTYSSSGNEDIDHVDLAEFAEGVSSLYPAEASALISAVDEMTVYLLDPTGYSNGVSVYFPYAVYYYYDVEYANYYVDIYETFEFSEGYTRFMNDFVAVLSGNTPTEWEGDEQFTEETPVTPPPTPENPNPVPQPVPDANGVVSHISLNLNDDQMNNFLRAERYIYVKNADGDYYLISKMRDVTVSGNNLTTPFNEYAYYLSDGVNQSEMCMIEYARTPYDIMFTSPAIISRSGARTPANVISEGIAVDLLVVFNSTHPQGMIYGYYRANDDNYETLYPLEKGMTILTTSYGISELEYDQYGNLKPLEKCDGVMYFYSNTVIAVDENTTLIQGRYNDGYEIYMSVVIYDVYGYSFSTSYRKTKEKLY